MLARRSAGCVSLEPRCRTRAITRACARAFTQVRALYRRQLDVPMAMSEGVVDEMLVRAGVAAQRAWWLGGAHAGASQRLDRELPAGMRLPEKEKASLEQVHACEGAAAARRSRARHRMRTCVRRGWAGAVKRRIARMNLEVSIATVAESLKGGSEESGRRARACVMCDWCVCVHACWCSDVLVVCCVRGGPRKACCNA